MEGETNVRRIHACILFASIMLGLAPGPDNIFILTQSAMSGRKSGLTVTLGLCTGLIVHTTTVAFGVAAIFQTSTIAFTALKAIGACYQAWKAFTSPATTLSEETGSEYSFRKLYLRGVIMNITNPKVSIFFLAFLPQFTSPENGSLALQIFLLGTLFILVTLMVFGGIALLAGTLGEWFNRSEKAQAFLSRIAGTIFAGLALKLITTEAGLE